MTQGLYAWSKTAATNSNADSSINWAEGQAPSSVNDSARAMMARLKEFVDDIAGLTTAGSATAFTVSTNQVFASLALMDGASFTIVPNVTSGDNPTVAADGLTAKPWRQFTGANILAGAFVAGTPYRVRYSNANNEFITHASASPWRTGDGRITLIAAADPGWVMADDGTIGSATSGGSNRANADTAALYAVLWNNVIDTWAPVTGGRGASAVADFAANKSIALTKQLGRAIAIAGSGSGLTARVLGQNLGEEGHALTAGEGPSHGHTGSGNVSDPGHNHNINEGTTGIAPPQAQVIAAQNNLASSTNAISVSGTGITVPSLNINSSGSGTAHNTMQPTGFWNVQIKL